jgi:large subunit ribosomal protein L6
MSRIGKLPIPIPAGVKVNIQGSQVRVSGPLGELTQELRSEVEARIENNTVQVVCRSEHRKARAFHGLYRTLVANMVEGVSKGFRKELEIHGVGFRAGIEKYQGEDCITFKKGELGLSHPIYFTIPAGVKAQMEGRNKIILSAADKSLLGLVAAKIRDLRPPDNYKGKGVRYAGEKVQIKVVKSGT